MMLRALNRFPEQPQAQLAELLILMVSLVAPSVSLGNRGVVQPRANRAVDRALDGCLSALKKPIRNRSVDPGDLGA